MKKTLSCPNCRHEIEVTELMRSHLVAEIRGEFDAEVTAARREIYPADCHKILDKHARVLATLVSGMQVHSTAF